MKNSFTLTRTIFLAALFCLMAGSGTAYSQETLTIGTGTNWSVNVDGNPYVGDGSPFGNFGRSEASVHFIYTADEMGGAKTITSLSFYHDSHSVQNDYIKIYLTHASSSIVNPNEPDTTAVPVYIGNGVTLGGTSEGWQNFTLDVPFEYNGIDNLVVIIFRIGFTTSVSDSPRWRYTSTANNYRCMYSHINSPVFLPFESYTFFFRRTYCRPNIKIGYTVPGGGYSCPTVMFYSKGYSNQQTVSSANISSIGNTKVTFAKGTGSSAPQYLSIDQAIRVNSNNTFTVSCSDPITSITLYYGANPRLNYPGFVVNTGSFSGDQYTASWTGSSTSVTFRVRTTSEAADNESYNSVPSNYKPYIKLVGIEVCTDSPCYGFETYSDANEWNFIQGTTNIWNWGTAAHSEGGHSLFIGNGATNTTYGYNNYDVNTRDVSYACRSVYLNSYTTYTLSYDWRVNGEKISNSFYDYMRVCVMPNSTVLTGGSLYSGLSYSTVPSGWQALDGGTALNNSTTWKSREEDFYVTTSGYYAIVFAWINDNSSGSQPPAAIDNVCLRKGGNLYTVKANKGTGINTAYVAEGTSFSGTATSIVVSSGSSATFKATLGANYNFDGWYNGSSKVSSSQTYTRTNISSNLTLTAKATPKSFNVIVDPGITHGTVTTNPSGTAQYTKTVTVNVTPDAGYEIVSVSTSPAITLTDNGNGTYTFTMPASDVTVTATFNPINYSITTVSVPTAGGSALAPSTATIGENITFSVSPYLNYELASVTISPETMLTDNGDGTYSFTMPASDVTITANFNELSCLAPSNVTVSNVTNHSADISWSGTSGSYNLWYRPSSLPETFLNESFEDATEYANWQAFANVSTNTGSYFGRITSAARTGDYGFSFTSYSNATDYNQYLISPQLSGTGTLEFYYRASSASTSGETFKVGYSSTSNTVSDFAWGPEISTSSTLWSFFRQDIPVGTKYIAIHYYAEYQYALFIDDIILKGDDQSTSEWQTVNGVSSPYELTGLVPETTYAVQIQGDCGADGLSQWSGETFFITGEHCPAPTDLAADNLAEHSAELSWTGQDDVYNLQYAPVTLYDFDNSSLSGWTTIDADGDGYTWEIFSTGGSYLTGSTGKGHNSSTDMVVSGSYTLVQQGGAALTPDNYLVSPQISLGGNISFWAHAYDEGYAADHFGVAVSTTNNTNASAFTTIAEWTMTAKNGAKQGSWYYYTVDLSAFSGQGYVAIRHFGCTDMFVLGVDDITIVESGTMVSVNDINTPYLLTGLETETLYAFQVQENCGEYGLGQWSTPLIFSTTEHCPAPTNLATTNITGYDADVNWNGSSESYNLWWRPAAYDVTYYNEDFEDADEFANWQAFGVVNTNTGSYFGRISFAARTGNYGFSFSSYDEATDYNQYLISPELNVTGTILEFYYRSSSTSSGGELFKVGYSSTGNNVEDFTWGEEYSTNSISWALFHEEIPAGTKYIAINYYPEYQYMLLIDDLSIKGDHHDAGEWITVNVEDSPYHITSLTPWTSYDVQVQGVCDSPDDMSPWSEMINFSTNDLCPTPLSEYVTECDSYTWHGQTYEATGVYTYDSIFPAGCTRLETLNLTINNSQISTTTVTACDSYNWNKQTYTESGFYTHIGDPLASGCDNIEYLDLTINYSENENYSVTECDSYIWHGETYETSGTYVFDTVTAAGCLRREVLDLTINYSDSDEFNVVECDTYTWYGTNYTESGEYTHESINAAGCPHTETLYLTINESQAQTYNITVCDVYRWQGETYTTSGTHVFDSILPNGCHRLETLNLTVNYSENEDFYETRCDSYTWYGQNYEESGTYYYYSTSAAGCPRTETLYLTINNSESETYNVTECDSYTWHGDTYDTSGTYSFDSILPTGCQRTETLNLTINTSETETYGVTECDSYTWHGETYETSGTHTFDSILPNGCHRVETLNLTINYSDGEEIYETKCDSFTWYGTTYTESGEYTHESTNAAGCLHTETLNLTINNSESETYTVTECDSYTWHGDTYDTSGTYSFDSILPTGCQRTETLNLTINQSELVEYTEEKCESFEWYGIPYDHSCEITVVSTTPEGCELTEIMHLTIYNNEEVEPEVIDACESYEWHGETYSQSGTYTDVTDLQAGCTKTETLNLTIHHNEVVAPEVVSACESYEWHGETYSQSGTYTYVTDLEAGCTRTETLNLTIYHDEFVEPEVVETCVSYTWHGVVYSESGTYTYETPLQAGCTRTETLDLTINNPVTNEIDVTACDVYIWNSVSYTEDGDYSQTLNAANGCDSIVTMHLTLKDGVTFEFDAETCDHYMWNNIVYGNAGDFTQTFGAANGCDSVVTMHLTIKDGVTYEFDAEECPGYTWNGSTYTTSGDYTQTYVASNECDSVVTMHLTIKDSPYNEFVMVACDSYDWDGVVYDAEGHYSHVYQAANGCDSVAVMMLILNTSPVANITGDLWVATGVQDSTTLTAWGGVSYQWSTGDTTQSITVAPNYETTYSVTVTDENGCSDVAEVTVINSTGIGENISNLNVYPNPTKNIVYVEADEIRNIRVCDVLGQVLFETNKVGNRVEIDLCPYAVGQYLLHIYTADGIATRKVVKR